MTTETKHAPEPWKVGNYGQVMTTDGRSIVVSGFSLTAGNPDPVGAINARRIVACVNYCQGVSTAEIEAAPNSMKLRAILDVFDAAAAAEDAKVAP